METLSVLPDGRIALCKMVHGTEITLVFQAKECPETLNKVTSQIMAAYAERKEKYGKNVKKWPEIERFFLRSGDSFPEPFTVLLEYRGCPNHPRCGRTNRPKRNDAR